MKKHSQNLQHRVAFYMLAIFTSVAFVSCEKNKTNNSDTTALSVDVLKNDEQIEEEFFTNRDTIRLPLPEIKEAIVFNGFVVEDSKPPALPYTVKAYDSRNDSVTATITADLGKYAFKATSNFLYPIKVVVDKPGKVLEVAVLDKAPGAGAQGPDFNLVTTGASSAPSSTKHYLKVKVANSLGTAISSYKVGYQTDIYGDRATEFTSSTGEKQFRFLEATANTFNVYLGGSSIPSLTFNKVGISRSARIHTQFIVP